VTNPRPSPQVEGKLRAVRRRRERLTRALETDIATADQWERREYAARSRMAFSASWLPPCALLALVTEMDGLGPSRGPRVLGAAIRLLVAEV
jgi:hypothetical protein